jgi:hypothetical protein
MKHYLQGNIHQQTVFKATYGDDPRCMDPVEHSKIITTAPDPKFVKHDPREPPGCYPDWIVTCGLVQDQGRTVIFKQNDVNRTSDWVMAMSEENLGRRCGG